MFARLVRGAVDVVGVPVDAVVRRSVPARSVVMLIYHRVGGRTPSAVDLPTDVFAAQLDVLADRVIDLDAAVDMLVAPDRRDTEHDDADEPSVVLTFDDGTADWVDVVLPELADRKLPATFYVSTDFVEAARAFPDGGHPVGWSGLSELLASGLATIGSHTHTHRVLADVTGAEATDEIDRSVGLVGERLGIGCDHFAYPKAIAPSAAAEVVVRRRFTSAALAGNRLNAVGATDPHRLGRHGLTVADDDSTFARKTAGGAWLEGRLRESRDRWLA